MQKYSEVGQSNILKHFNLTVDELEQKVWKIVEDRWEAMPSIWSEIVKPIEIQLAGSYIRCINTEKSDLDVILLYTGNVSPKTILKYVNYPFRAIEDVNRKLRRVDFNPIHISKFSTCMDYINYLETR